MATLRPWMEHYPAGMARIGVVAAEVFPLYCCKQQISHPPLWRRAMPTGGGASVAQV